MKDKIYREFMHPQLSDTFLIRQHKYESHTESVDIHIFNAGYNYKRSIDPQGLKITDLIEYVEGLSSMVDKLKDIVEEIKQERLDG